MQSISWRELNGRKTSYALRPEMLRGVYVRAVDCRPTPYKIDRPHGTYSVEFDRLYAIEKVRELIVSPLRECPLVEILELVLIAYSVERPDLPLLGINLENILNQGAADA